MSRLADYVVIVGYDHEKDRSGISCGKILQRFPESDWDDAPFIEGIELFCQPLGWSLSKIHQEPKFFVSVLTDIDANRHYCACLSFSETEAIMPTKPADDEDLDDMDIHHPHLPNNTPLISTHTHHSIMYAPKCLVLVSRLNYFETFRNCLGIIYTVYIESMPISMETLIGNILGCVQVPPPGGPQVRFSIGAGDRQALQPPLSGNLPVTHSVVATLFEQLGIHNVLSVYCAVLTEQKIVFHSCSYNRLTESCHAIISLLYPMKYSHVYIPLLPSSLIEFLSTPTPFIMGIHSSLKNEIRDLMDVIVVDLDGGSIFVPECINLAMLPEPYYSFVHNSVSTVLHPELIIADNAFPPSSSVMSPQVVLDKEIRAIFLHLFAQLLLGYRSCLTVIRIHPKPFISFHKAAFLGQRNLMEDSFMTKVLDCMFFNTFVAERGPPYRVCDIFDELYASMQDNNKHQNGNSMMMHNITELAQQLFNHENPNPQPYVQKIPKPTEGAFTRIHLPPFAKVDPNLVNDIIADGLATNNLKARLQSLRPQQPRIVPLGPPISSVENNRHSVNNSARRLEVLRNCVNCIFDGKILDARKSFPAVLRALKSKVARLALCQELCQHVVGNKAMLEHQQFDLVVRLMNSALQDDSHMDEYGVAAALLPLSTAFCRKLCTGVIQFAYTCIQDHPVWNNLQFWEAAFYQDVQKDIKALYTTRSDGLRPTGLSRESAINSISSREGKELIISWNKDRWSASTEYSSRKSTVYLRPQEQNALEIAAEQMRTWPSIPKTKQEEMVANEESTVYSQAIHFANRIVYLRVPLDSSNHLTRSASLEGESNSNSNITNSVAESDSLDAESGFEEDTSEVGTNVIRFVSRFVDKVCTESGVTDDHIKALHQMIPGVVAMHIETLEAVSRESKRLPPIQKPKILSPVLLPGEELILEGLRVYLLPDGREEGLGGPFGGPAFLPAEGAIFLTNYRLIFKGTPCDSFASELQVIRCFPVASLTKEKRISSQFLTHLDQYLQEGLQLRSNTFQLIKVGFDEEVTSDSIESFRKFINRVRNPTTIFNLFAFAGQDSSPHAPLEKQKEKNATLRQFAKKTLFKTAAKAGFKQKPESRKHKYSLTAIQSKSMTTPGPGRALSTVQNLGPDISHLGRPMSFFEDDGSNETKGDDTELPQQPPLIVVQTDSKTLEKMTESSYCRDYQRLGLGNSNNSSQRNKLEPFRITTVNSSYSVCLSYPALVAVPQNVSDESIRRLCRCHRHNRFPVITWRHPRTKSLLLRGGSFNSKGVIGMLKGHPASSATVSETSASLEQEKFIAAIAQSTPKYNIRQSAWSSMNDSSLSINSLVLAAGAGNEGFATLTPESSRRSNPFSKAVNTLRTSGGKTSKQFSRWGSLKDRGGSSSSIGSDSVLRGSARLSDTDSGVDGAVHSFRKAAVYVFGEKTQIKGIRPDSYPMCDFIPMDFHDVRHIKASFKKLMRACVPSSPSDAEQGFLKAVESSEWLNQLQTVLQISGAAVDLMDVQGSSVIVCLEDGWDITTQIVSVAQICLDPYYRTMEGFKTLIEKEWLGFGHRFTHRGNQAASTQGSGFAPVFLQFLDAVHQICRQFPLSFEFNQYFLKFLAYHYVSCRFRTFMLDSEFERMEAGWLVEERIAKHRTLDTYSDDELGAYNKIGQSLWDYIDKYNSKSPIFFNFLYCPDQENMVLRPYSNISNLKIWDYYVSENLSCGPSYDLELATSNLDADIHETSLSSSNRRIINSCYDNVSSSIPDAFTCLLKDIHHLESELGHLPQKWKVLWDKLELPNVDSLTRQASLTTQLIRSHGRSIHKRSTVEILVKGKMVGETVQMYSHMHRFEKYTYARPTNCGYCSHVLWGLIPTGMRCMDCGYDCHEKCMESVPKNCTKYKSVIDNGQAAVTLAKSTGSDSASVASSVSTIQSTSQYYDQFSSNVAEHRTHEGYLFKRGALLKGWKQRWFVLDSIKHQMRYYDALEDSHCKGFIDLAEVMSVGQTSWSQGAPKRADEKGFFDLKTTKRTYNFLAIDATAAQEWVEKIQACLQ